MSEIAPELVSRMIALIETVAANGKNTSSGVMGYADEAKAIIALLPEPVDPDLIEARKISLAYGLPAALHRLTMRRTKAGEADGKVAIQSVLEALKRGRELEAARLSPMDGRE